MGGEMIIKPGKNVIGLALAAVLLLTCALPGAARAAESKSDSVQFEKNDEGSLSTDPWRFRFNAYGWLPDAPATINFRGNEVVDVPEDVGTILDSLEVAAMLEFEVHKGPFLFFTNLIYYEGNFTDNFIGAISGQSREFRLEEEVLAIKYAGAYRLGPWKLGESPDAADLALYPWVGGFFFRDEYSVDVDPIGAGPILSGTQSSGTFEFNTPMVGLGARSNFKKKWYLNFSYGYGGWNVDDVDEIWDLIVNVGYNFKMGGVSTRVYAGYRYLYINWAKDGKELELDARGPFFGIGWNF